MKKYNIINIKGVRIASCIQHGTDSSNTGHAVNVVTNGTSEISKIICNSKGRGCPHSDSCHLNAEQRRLSVHLILDMNL